MSITSNFKKKVPWQISIKVSPLKQTFQLTNTVFYFSLLHSTLRIRKAFTGKVVSIVHAVLVHIPKPQNCKVFIERKVHALETL